MRGLEKKLRTDEGLAAVLRQLSESISLIASSIENKEIKDYDVNCCFGAISERVSFISNFLQNKESGISLNVERHTVCKICYSVGISHPDCDCCHMNNYPTIELEFEVCNTCGNLVDDGHPVENEFNKEQQKNEKI